MYMSDDYQFEDIDSSSSAAAAPSSPKPRGESRSGGNGGYANELFSKQIKAKFRTFFVDLKESQNGKFVKISEKSHGKKSTIMMDAEDIPALIDALKEVQGQL
jgi:hypothetical protein